MSPPSVEPKPEPHAEPEADRKIEKHKVRPLTASTVELRFDLQAVAGEGWVSPRYLIDLANGIAAIEEVSPDQRIHAALKVAELVFPPRLPGIDVSSFGEIIGGQHRASALAEFIHTNLALFESACGRSGDVFRPLEGEASEDINARIWAQCDFDRYELGDGGLTSPYAFLAIMLHTALDRHGGVLPQERFILREMMHLPETVFAPYAEQRKQLAAIPLRVEGSAPQAFDQPATPAGVDVVTIHSGTLDLPAWYAPPSGRGKAPGLVYLHGGFAFAAEDFAVTQAFRDAGFAVLTPTLRGENGNPGSFEMMLGEVDDAAAAVRWLADRREVDSDQVYAFGHSAGGNIAALLTLIDDLPLAHSGSAGMFFLDTDFAEMVAITPFDPLDRLQTNARTILSHTDEMQVPHYAWFAAPTEVSDGLVAERLEGKLRVGIVINEDHMSQLPKALTKYLRCIEAPTQCPKREGDDDRIIRLLREPVQ